jgi:alpha-beta hydrolase superfamily lysophospholipase
MDDEINLTSTANLLSFAAHSSRRNWTIKARSWGDPDTSQAGALLVHGLGAHSGWFEAFARRLSARGIFTISYDQVGFGSRRDELFHSKNEWLDDLIASWKQLKTIAGANQKPLYLIGNSMGAVVAYSGVESVKPDAMVLFSPGFDGHPGTFNLGYKLKALVAAIFAPDSDVVLPYAVEDITPSQSVRDFLTADPDRRFAISARMGLELLKLTLATKGGQKSAPCPVLMATAGIEKIVDNHVSEKLFKELTAPVKKRLIYPSAMHDLMFDPNLNGIVDDVCNWLASLPKTTANEISTSK